MKNLLGKFYTTNYKKIIGDLIPFFDDKNDIIDPFAGSGHLFFRDGIEGYDILPEHDKIIKRDTLKNPLDYKDKWILTNPPYLAKNKNKDKTYYEMYNTNDLYKCSLSSIIGCEGGVLIIPINFFSSKDDKIRKKFLSEYKIDRIKVFDTPVFEDTTYNVCSFIFYKEKNMEQNILFDFIDSGKSVNVNINYDSGYRIGSELYSLPQGDIKFIRLLNNMIPNSKLYLKGVDTRNGEKIHMKIQEPFYGKITDRCFATFNTEPELDIKTQEKLVNEFNKRLNYYRNKYNSLFLTNYRDYSRKRIDFKLTTRILSNIYKEQK